MDEQQTADAAPEEELQPDAPAEEGAEEAPETPPETEDQRIERMAQERAQTLAQKRINELTYKYREAERRAEALEAQRRQPPPEPENPQPRAEPRIENYDTVDEFLRDRDVWLLDQFDSRLSAREQAAAAKQQEQRAQQEWQERHRTFETAEREYVASLPPEAQAAYNASTQQLDPILLDGAGRIRSPDLVRALMEAGPKVAHALAQDLDLAMRLVQSDPLTIGREIGKLERGVSDGGRLGRRFSQAAPPPPTLQGGGSAGIPKDYAAMSDEEFTRVRQAEIDAERRR